jgi:hypothetical protein
LENSLSSRRKIHPRSLRKQRVKKSLVLETPKKIGQFKADRRFTEEKRREDDIRVSEVKLQGKNDQATGICQLDEDINEDIKIMEFPVTKSGAKFDSVLAKRRYCARLENNGVNTSKASENFKSPKLSSNFYGNLNFYFRILS